MAKRDLYQAHRSAPFTNREMQAMTDVSLMTLHLWRKGTVTKAVLRSSKTPSGTIQYPVKSTLNWMRKHDIEPRVHPDDLDKEPAKKPGPSRSKRPAEMSAAH